MKHYKTMERHYEILSHISRLPRQILSFHDREHLAQFILHELCKEQCFNINKAAYFIDSPDFDCFKGVAGHSRAELESNFQGNFHNFAKDIVKLEFNKKVRQHSDFSLKKNENEQKKRAAELAKDLGMKNYVYCSWNMKHDNHGLFIYEDQDHTDKVHEEELLNGLSLLSFCPIF
jgi:hypothetical protein